MQLLAQEVLELQSSWTAQNTPQMQRRGVIIRREIPSWLNEYMGIFKSEMGVAGADLAIEGRDATGPKAQIPWVRVYSDSRSPNAQTGWYCVYLFRADGAGMYLSLAHGATKWENGEFKPRSFEELSKYVNWARSVLQIELNSLSNLSKSIELRGTTKLGPAYAQGSAASIFYPVVPSETKLIADLKTFSGLLAKLYNQEDLGRTPEGPELQAQILQSEIEALIEPKKGKSLGQGRGLTIAERITVEQYAMEKAQDYLSANGYELTDVSKKNLMTLLQQKMEPQ